MINTKISRLSMVQTPESGGPEAQILYDKIKYLFLENGSRPGPRFVMLTVHQENLYDFKVSCCLLFRIPRS